MNNKKIAAGILTIIAASLFVGLALSSKKGRQAGRNFIKKGNRLAGNLKGKFNEFVDQANDKLQGMVK